MAEVFFVVIKTSLPYFLTVSSQTSLDGETMDDFHMVTKSLRIPCGE
jgi:hypothetical protein